MKKMIAVLCVLLLMTALLTVTVSAAGDQLATPQITVCESLDEGVGITWDPVDGAELYRVYYMGSKGWTRMGDTTDTSFVDTVVSSGGTYTYTVRCLNAAASAFTSDFDHAGYRYTYNMATPQITKLEDSEEGVDITWNAVPNAKSYRVYYKNSKGGWTKMAETDKTSYLDTDVSYGGSYTYTVRCVNAAGTRFTSSFNSDGWKHTYYLPSPEITGFKSLGKGVQINWDKVAGAEKYRVYYYGRNGWTKMGETTGTSFIDDDVNVGSTYRYTVRCLNSAMTKFTSDCNGNGWRYTYDPQLDTPQIDRVEAVANGVEIHWNAVDGADLYRVYYKGSKGWTRMADVRGTSYVDSDVSGGHTYTYTVRCLSQGGKSFASDYDHNGTKFYLYRNPEIEDMTVYTDRIEFSVFAEHCHNVRIYRKSSSGGWTRIGEIDSEEDGCFCDYDVAVDKTYTYTARCVDENGVFLSYFNTNGREQIYSPEYSYPELEFFMYNGDDLALVQVKNDNKFGIEHFNMHVMVDGEYRGSFTPTDEPTYIRADFFMVDREYLFYIVGVDESGNQITQMNAVWVQTMGAPTDLKAEKTGDRSYLFSWNKGAGGCDGYNLYLSTVDGELEENYIVTDGTSYEVDLSGYPEDTEWRVLVWAAFENEPSVSAPTHMNFKESDYQYSLS